MGLAIALAHLSGAKILEVSNVRPVQFRVATGGGATLAIHAVIGNPKEGGGWSVLCINGSRDDLRRWHTT